MNTVVKCFLYVTLLTILILLEKMTQSPVYIKLKMVQHSKQRILQHEKNDK